MSKLRQIFYVSRIAGPAEDRAIRNILSISRRTNRMLDITGCLTCTGRHFAQVIEGRNAAIAELMPRIAADGRHAECRIVFDRPLTLRQYPLWSMAYLLDVGLDGDIEALLMGPGPTLRNAVQFAKRLRPDTVMGPL
jgi:hypothetical protein